MNVLMYFSASWCQPCRQFGPIIEQVRDDGIPVVKVDVDSERTISNKYGIKSVPTVILVDGNNKELKRFVGSKSFNEVINFYKGG